MLNTKFCSRLKELRSEKGLTQQALADAIGVSKAIISLWEADLREPGLSYLIKLADYFGESLDYIAGRID